jgi:hypothetical protein
MKAARAAALKGKYPRRDSNLRPLAPEASALSTELRGQALRRIAAGPDTVNFGHCLVVSRFEVFSARSLLICVFAVS